MDNTKISTWEFISLTSIITFTPLLVTLPRSAAETFGTATLLHAIYISIIATLFFFAIFKLYKNLEGKDLYDLSEAIGGNKLKIFTGILVIAYLVTACFITIHEFSEDVKNVLFVNASVQNVSIIFVIGISIAAFFGIKGMIRISSVLFPVIIIGLVAIFLSLMKDFDLTNFTPILGTGAKEIFWDGLMHAGRYNSLFLVFLLAPKVTNLKKSGMLSVLSTSAVIITVVFLIFSIIPYPEILENYFSFYEVTKMISYGRFFQRVEVIFTFLWLFVSLIYLSTAFATIIYTFKKAFKLEYPNLVLPTLALIFISLLYYLPNCTSLILTREFMYTFITPIIVFVYPLVLLIFCRIKGIDKANERIDIKNEKD